MRFVDGFCRHVLTVIDTKSILSLYTLYVSMFLVYVEVVRIPRGAVHIQVAEAKLSKNYLGKAMPRVMTASDLVVFYISSNNYSTR